jgi:uncharacterized protein (UPF0276 family)
MPIDKNIFTPNMAPLFLHGIGLRHPHIEYFYDQVTTDEDIFQCEVDFLEIHAENFLALASPRTEALLKIAEKYPLSCHGVGLSLGSYDGVDKMHLENFKNLCDATSPFLISEHVSWARHNGQYLNDLLPLPYTQESLDIIAKNIDFVQNYLGRQILIENPSSYMMFDINEMHEYDFMRKIAEKAGCAILLDLNNIYISCLNHGMDLYDYIDHIPLNMIGEIHLAGHVKENIDGKIIYIDTHSRPICHDVWQFYHHVIARLHDHLSPLQSTSSLPIPTLIEWDLDIPPLSTLLAARDKAHDITRRIVGGGT